MNPIVSIVGRPNVGKSTLFNRIAGAPIAIVEDLPGTTRDRIFADVRVLDNEITLIDTGGLEPVPGSEMSRKIKKQVCLLYTSPSPRDRTRSRMPSSA